MLATHLKFRDANNNLDDKLDEAKKTENAQLNGILKNNNKNSSVSSHQTKNISFLDENANV